LCDVACQRLIWTSTLRLIPARASEIKVNLGVLGGHRHTHGMHRSLCVSVLSIDLTACSIMHIAYMQRQTAGVLCVTKPSDQHIFFSSSTWHSECSWTFCDERRTSLADTMGKREAESILQKLLDIRPANILCLLNLHHAKNLSCRGCDQYLNSLISANSTYVD
jgi:hypothetical protein